MRTRLQKIWAGSGEEYYNQIVSLFGKDILKEDLEIDRKKLSKVIFFDKDKKEKLDRLTNEYVVPKIIEEARKEEISVIDVPLLFESRLNESCDIVIGVIADKEICIERITKRDGIDKEIAAARINNQFTEEFFKRKCDYCIFNEDEKSLEYQINEIFSRKQFIKWQYDTSV